MTTLQNTINEVIVRQVFSSFFNDWKLMIKLRLVLLLKFVGWGPMYWETRYEECSLYQIFTYLNIKKINISCNLFDTPFLFYLIRWTIFWNMYNLAR
jgi:hypothetical protein